MDQQGITKQDNLKQPVATKQETVKQPVVTKQQALRMLETYFGYTSFRPAQEAPIASLLRNEDVIGIMPTGAGKSICFQIPALCKAGLTMMVLNNLPPATKPDDV
jgi:ATP-dependent DNA helicase RecQ